MRRCPPPLRRRSPFLLVFPVGKSFALWAASPLSHKASLCGSPIGGFRFIEPGGGHIYPFGARVTKGSDPPPLREVDAYPLG